MNMEFIKTRIKDHESAVDSLIKKLTMRELTRQESDEYLRHLEILNTLRKQSR